MIQSVTVTNAKDESLVLELMHPEKSGYAITEITGIGPVKANITSSDNAAGDGAVFNNARVSTRNIVINLRFIGVDIEGLRQNTTKYFPVKQEITLRFVTDKRVVYTTGYVESNEPDIFSKTEGCKISILCPYPHFKMGYGTKDYVSFNGVEDTLEFPLSNESLTDSLIECSVMRTVATGNLRYNGDSDIGVVITAHAYGSVSTLTIYNTVTREKMVLDLSKVETLTGTAFGAGDEVIISTVKNSKSVRLLRDGVYTDILRCLDLTSDWFTITKGDNVFSYTVDTDINNLLLKIENDVIYEGV